MTEAVALKEIYYDGRTVKKGERFMIQPQHLRLYQILKKAEPAPEEIEEAPKPRGRRAMMAADPPAPEPAQAERSPAETTETPPLGLGRYARRDMRPVDDES